MAHASLRVSCVEQTDVAGFGVRALRRTLWDRFALVLRGTYQGLFRGEYTAFFYLALYCRLRASHMQPQSRTRLPKRLPSKFCVIVAVTRMRTNSSFLLFTAQHLTARSLKCTKTEHDKTLITQDFFLTSLAPHVSLAEKSFPSLFAPPAAPPTSLAFPRNLLDNIMHYVNTVVVVVCVCFVFVCVEH